MVWRLRSVHGHGWLRDLDAAGPIVTGDRAEAQQFTSAAEAEAALWAVNRPDRVRWRIEEGEATEPYLRGL